MRLLRMFRWLVIMLALGSEAVAAVSVSAEVTPIALRTRSGAPSIVSVKLRVTGAPLVQGRLELALSRLDGDGAIVRSHEIAVPASGLELRMILPPLAGRDEVSVKAHFVTERGVFPAGESRLWTLPGGQDFIMAVVGGQTSVPEGAARLWQELRLDRFAEDSLGRSATWSTTPAFFEVADLPEFALAWCAFDVVILDGDSFSRLRQRQLDSLVQWVEAGGNVFIVGAGQLSPDHFRALQRVVASALGGAKLERDGAGRLLPTTDPIIRARAELGRCVLAAQPPSRPGDFAREEWRETAAFLWRISEAGMDQIRRGERRIGPADGNIINSWQWSRTVTESLQTLFPANVRMLPLGVIAGLLAGFVLAVGPGEWFVLGWLRRRRWTWLVFPLSTAAFTATTILAANHYLGRNDLRTAIRVVDVGRSGRVLRESRIEMFLVGRSQTLKTEHSRELLVPASFSTRFDPQSSPNRPARYEGQHPLRFSVSHELKQWEPRIIRRLTLDAAPDASGIAWGAITARDLVTESKPASLFAQRCNVGAHAIHVYHRGQLVEGTAGSESHREFIRHLSNHPHGLMGKILSSLAPSGDPQLSDLTAGDLGDFREWVVIAFSREDSTLTIHRRIYRTDE